MRCSLALVALIATSASADTSVPQPVVGYRVRGDSKVTERTVGYLLHVGLGSMISLADLPRLEQALVTSELFEKSAITLEDAPGGVLIVATVEDKLSWIIAPALFVLPGNRAFGVGYVENNLAGEDRKMLLYGQIGDRNTFFFGTYLDPAVRGSSWQFRFDLYPLRRQIDEYTNDPANPRSHQVSRSTTFTFLDAGILLGYAFHWWLIWDFRLRGAYSYFRDAKDAGGNPLPIPEKDGWDISAQTHLTLDARHHHYGVTWGPYLQATVEQTIPGFDSYGGGSMLLRAHYAWRVFCEHEFELRGHLNAGYHLPLNEDLTLGGVTDLRGYNVDQFRGDRRALFRAEYSVPITRWRFLSFRALGFFDSGYAAFGSHRTDGDRIYLPTQTGNAHWFRNDVGVGLRVYVSSIVLPLLGLDFGYGIEGHSPEIYFELGLTDF